MARGFESKSVESQQHDATHRVQLGPELTPDEREKRSTKAGLELALAQTQAEIGAACRPAHREMLRLRLEAIRTQLATLS
jgi:predicted transcriptional regulator